VDGPKVAPGKYKARFRYDNDSAEVSFVIKGDPNYAMTEADYDAQLGMLLQIRDKFTEVQKAIKNIREIRSQINDFTSRMDTTNNKEIKQMADTINKQIKTIEEALYQTKSKSGQDVLNYPIRLNDKIAGLYDVAASGYNPPSKPMKESFADLSSQADVQLNKLKKIMTENLPALNKLINQKQLPVIGLKKDND
jgi:methyl-accepting chemotaxis protein